MSTYYQYKDVKVKIAHRLMKMDGWTVYGYHADNSDSMTDYYDPAYWDGIAIKNGYKLCVGMYGSREDSTDTYTKYIEGISAADAEKIKKLENMTQDKGASEDEERSAKKSIAKIRARIEAGTETVEVFHPGHMKHPPRCNWHIEKDGIIIDKGSGILKYARVPDISGYGYIWEQKAWQDFNNLSREQWIEKEMSAATWGRYPTREQAEESYEDAKESYSLLEKFNALISRWNSVCGGMMGDSDGTYTYERVTKTEYRTEIKAVETESGSVKDGQCFILKSSFNYGRNKGYVYRIHATEYENGTISYHAYRMNGKKTKECRGSANAANSWYIGTDPESLLKWFTRGALAWCELTEVKVPYDVEKVVKKFHNSDPVSESSQNAPESTETSDSATSEEKTDSVTDAPTESTQDTETVSESHTDDSSQERSEQDANTENDSDREQFGFSDFEELAKAFATGKTVKNKKRENPSESTKTEQAEEVPDESVESCQDATESATEKKPDPLYNDNFTAEEIAALVTGGRIVKHVDRYTVHYIAVNSDRNNAAWYLYKQENYNFENINIGHRDSLNYCGFIFNGKIYTDAARINEAFSQAVSDKIREILPDVETILNTCEISEWGRKSIEETQSWSFENEIRRYFYQGDSPTFSAIESYRDRKDSYTAFYYITRQKEAVEEYARQEIENNIVPIAKTYIRYNTIMAGLNEIRNNPDRVEHIAKRMMESVNDEKTVTIKTIDGEKYKVEKRAISNIGYNMKIYSYNFKGRKDDLEITDIAEITHGRRVLYSCA